MARRPGSAGAGRCFHDQVLAGSVGEPAPGLRTAPRRIPPPLFSFSLRPGSLRKIGTDECRDADAFAGKPYALATGVGDPAQVWETVARFMGREPAEYIVYPDHHAYTPEDAAKLEGLGMSVICTSKDAVKLRELRLADAWALRVEAAFGPALWTEAAFPHWLDAWAKRKGLF